MPRFACASFSLILLLASSASALAQEAALLVENRSGVALVFRAGSGFQGSLARPLPQEIAPGETGRGLVRAGFPATQGGGFRYVAGAAECDFGFLRMREGVGGPWGHPQTRARASDRGLSCRAEVAEFFAGGDFTIRFIVE
jgi:hypothetical protein